MASIPYQSTEFITFPVQVKSNGEVVDPTGFTIEFSLTETTATEPGTWAVGSWGSSASRYFGKVLIGPAGGALDPGAAGAKTLWTKISTGTETIIREVGRITFT